MFKSIKITHLCLSICTCFAIGHSENQTLPAYTPGNPLTDASLSPGYPVDASYVTGNGWNPHITANYLYWNWDSSNFTIGDLDGANSISSSTWEKVSPGYSSGFKVGAGFNLKNLDQWDFYSEYTWYKNSGERTLTGTDSIPLSFPVGGSPLSNKDLVGSVNTEFALGFQALDVSLEKSLYAGKNLILRIGSGLKTLWVSESKTQSSNNVLVNGTDVYQNYHLNFSQTSWSLGPKLHLNLDWLIGYGMKVLFNFSPSVLYTSFNLEGLRTDILNGTFESAHINRLHNYGTITPVIESFLGLGWGQYFCKDQFHLDLLVGYDFNTYWNFDYLGPYVIYPEDMSLYGLNIQVRFDF